MKKVLPYSVAALAVLRFLITLVSFSADDNATSLTGADMFTNDKDLIIQ